MRALGILGIVLALGAGVLFVSRHLKGRPSRAVATPVIQPQPTVPPPTMVPAPRPTPPPTKPLRSLVVAAPDPSLFQAQAQENARNAEAALPPFFLAEQLQSPVILSRGSLAAGWKEAEALERITADSRATALHGLLLVEGEHYEDALGIMGPLLASSQAGWGQDLWDTVGRTLALLLTRPGHAPDCGDVAILATLRGRVSVPAQSMVIQEEGFFKETHRDLIAGCQEYQTP